MKFTGNELIDKHIKRGLGPMDRVNMDDYWGQHPTFLEYISNVGNEDDIKLMFEENFGIQNLFKEGSTAKRILIKHGYAQGLLAYDDDPIIRAQVAKYCDKPEHFINDDAYEVKAVLIQRGIGIDKFTYDDDKWAQLEVAKQGYNLDYFINSPYNFIRAQVAEQRYGLDQLSHDSDMKVLESVARQGYDPERFANHESKDLQYAACQAGAFPEKFIKNLLLQQCQYV